VIADGPIQGRKEEVLTMAKSTTQTPETPAADTPPVDGSTPITLTFDQLKELLGSGGGNTAAVAALTAQLHADGVLKQNPNPPLQSAFNPEGELANPRPPLIGTYFWLNTRLQAEELTREEITLLNALKPGVYGEYGAWVVENLSPGMGRAEDKKLQITFPNKDADHRAALPSMVDMLRRMVREQYALVSA
jgi:hypothetical protein